MELDSNASEEEELVHLQMGRRGDYHSMVLWFSERDGRPATYCYVNSAGVAQLSQIKVSEDI